ncbi:MAG: GNAT family N-acetyltransferase [Bacteroides sp.]|nr:GNAT family N-acetyltransferase [Bacteroides sp.]
MKLIEADLSAIPAIRKIADEVWPRTFGNILSSRQISYMMEMMYSTDALERQMKEQGHRYILALDGEEPVGYISYETGYRGQSWTKIHKIYVLTTMQGRGVGRLLMEKVADIACTHGDDQLSLNVNRHNPAIDFYRRMGFEIIDQEDIDIGGGFLMEDYVMNCPVT